MEQNSEHSVVLLNLATKCLNGLIFSRSAAAEPPEELIGIEGFTQLYSTLYEIRTAIKAFSGGNLGYKVRGKGYVPGTLKELQAALNHLTWQTKMIASGDFSQHVEFMGDFSESFNSMVTQLAASRDSLSNAKEHAESANRTKSEFLANMSHEIRTPMNGIIGMTQLLNLTELTEEQQEYLGHIDASGRNLLILINDILDLSKIESGMIDLEHVEFSLKQAINDVIDSQLSAINNKHLAITFDMAPDVPEIVLGDQLHFKQIILNLLGNAIKFTAQGGISIFVLLENRLEDTAVIRISVTDTGIGIASEKLEKIFGAFTQADSSTTRKYGGTGLGLTICRRLSELMGGSVLVESSPGEGSVFRVSLLFEVGQQKEAASSGRPADQCLWDGPPLSILVAEDNPVNQRFISIILRKMGHEVVCSNDGAQAVKAWRNGRFDCILMDIQMPVMGGEEALQQIRKEEETTGGCIPIIAMTAHALKGDRERFLELGFDGYLSKPLQLDELTGEFRRL